MKEPEKKLIGLVLQMEIMLDLAMVVSFDKQPLSALHLDVDHWSVLTTISF